MSKKPGRPRTTALDRAIQGIDADIATLQLARKHLVAQQPKAGRRVDVTAFGGTETHYTEAKAKP